MTTTTKSNNGAITLRVGDTLITISPVNGQLPTKRAYKARKPRASTGRPVGRPRKVPVAAPEV